MEKNKGIYVLSLFDGCSGGQQALKRLGKKVNTYYASEIDKYAIKVTMENFPNTIQLGSVINVDGNSLPKIDLLMGGSPCQSFSFVGKRKGMSTKCETEILTLEHYLQLKSEGYEFEGQSYLFWEYMRLLTELRAKNPNVLFLLENVEMGEKWEKVLSKAIGVNGIHINSALLSAQNRKRIYWTNIGMEQSGLFGDLQSIIQQPKDKGILLKQILETNVDEKYFISQKMENYLNSRKDNFNNGKINYKYGNEKASTITDCSKSIDISDNIIVHNLQKRDANRPSLLKNPNAGGSGHLSRADGKTYVLDCGNSQAIELPIGPQQISTIYDNNAQAGRIYSEEGKSVTINSNGGGLGGKTGLYLVNGENGFNTNNDRLNQTLNLHSNNIEHGTIIDSYNKTIHKDKSIAIISRVNASNMVHIADNSAICVRQVGRNPDNPKSRESGLPTEQMIEVGTSRIRRLTPTECERLQTMDDGYTAHVSDSQRYKMIGNGWTIDVIAHILNYIKK